MTLLSELLPSENALLAATKQAAAASLAGGIIAASGRPHTVEEAFEVFTDAFFTLYPDPNHGRYSMWKAARDAKKATGGA